MVRRPPYLLLTKVADFRGHARKGNKYGIVVNQFEEMGTIVSRQNCRCDGPALGTLGKSII